MANTFVARATIRETPDSPLVFLYLALDSDGRYRWHQFTDNADTEVSGATIEEAIDAAWDSWRSWEFSGVLA